MWRLLGVLILTAALAGCGDKVVEYSISAAAIEEFAANADKLGARNDALSPLATSILANNRIDAPAGVTIDLPDPILRSVGINNGDLIAFVDGKVPSRDYGSAFAAGQKPFASATEQYVHFVSGLFALRETQDTVLLSIHPKYRTIAERKKHGGYYAREPKLIRIVFP